VLAMLTGPLEEWANRLATGAVADPQHACSLRIELEPQATRVPRCGRCLEPCPLIHERRLLHVRDRDLLDQQGIFSYGARGDDVVAWPESGKINRMHGDSRVWGLGC
jgi:hypothetical protein